MQRAGEHESAPQSLRVSPVRPGRLGRHAQQLRAPAELRTAARSDILALVDDRPSIDGSAARRILLIGHDELTAVTQRALESAGAYVRHLRDPHDRAIRKALQEEVDAVVVISRDDHVSLRIALVVGGVRPGVALIVTVFDRDVSKQLERAVENVRVMSMADIVVPTFAGPCFDDRLLSVVRTPTGFEGVQADDGGPRLVPIEPQVPHPGRRLLAAVGSLLRPYEVSARILMAGLLGFHVILLLDTAVLATALDMGIVEAFYAAAKTIVTVGPSPLVDEGPGWLKLFSAGAMLTALAFTAIFTAGVVDRLLDRRLTAMAGPRSVPRRDHVVVVGLGQVGLRLCLLLRELRVPVVAIEANPDHDYVLRAKHYGIPVLIGRGTSRHLLERLSLQRARALVATTSDEVQNIAIAVTALGQREDLRTLLRAGTGEVVNETRSLFSIGVVRDVYRIGGTLLAAAALGSDVKGAFLHEKTVYVVGPDGRIVPFEGDLRDTPRLESSSGAGEASPAPVSEG